MALSLEQRSVGHQVLLQQPFQRRTWRCVWIQEEGSWMQQMMNRMKFSGESIVSSLRSLVRGSIGVSSSNQLSIFPFSAECGGSNFTCLFQEELHQSETKMEDYQKHLIPQPVHPLWLYFHCQHPVFATNLWSHSAASCFHWPCCSVQLTRHWLPLSGSTNHINSWIQMCHIWVIHWSCDLHLHSFLSNIWDCNHWICPVWIVFFHFANLLIHLCD